MVYMAQFPEAPGSKIYGHRTVLDYDILATVMHCFTLYWDSKNWQCYHAKFSTTICYLPHFVKHCLHLSILPQMQILLRGITQKIFNSVNDLENTVYLIM